MKVLEAAAASLLNESIPCSSIVTFGIVIVAQPERAIVSFYHGPAEQHVSRGCQWQIQCCCGVVLSSKPEDNQVDVSSPDQVNGRMPGWLDNVRHRVLEPTGWAELCDRMLTNVASYGMTPSHTKVMSTFLQHIRVRISVWYFGHFKTCSDSTLLSQ